MYVNVLISLDVVARHTAHNGSAARTARVLAMESAMISSRQVVEEKRKMGQHSY